MSKLFHGHLDLLLAKSQRKLLFEKLLLLVALLGLYLALFIEFGAVVPAAHLLMIFAVFTLAILAVLVVVIYPFIKRREKLNAANLLEHLNRQFPELEESVQLLNQAPEGILQQLQQKRISAIFDTLFHAGQLADCLPPVRFKTSLALFMMALLIYVAGGTVDWTASPTVVDHKVTKPAATNTLPILLSTQVQVHPPAYTGLAVTQFSQGDIEITQGSTVRWQLTFSDTAADYRILLDDEVSIALLRQPDGSFSASTVIDKTAIYRIGLAQGRDLPGVYSILVNRDKPPEVRIVEPETSLVKLAKSAVPRFHAKALVNDDYGISEVKILASVAKGSGEAVKFRDEEFAFDHHVKTGPAELYSKDWDLTQLGMEPGDEVYFTVVATDNKADGAQEGRSGTVIVRWLDDEEAVLTADGIVLDFAIEYFRSQRQIIIETEQLIAGKGNLTEQQFLAMSQELGQAQGDLKQRYGQYLGDEFGEGPGDQLKIDDTDDDDEQKHQEQHEKEADETHDETHQHKHQHQSQEAESHRSGKATAAELIAQFSHAHEEVYVGAVSQNNPKAMMKKAVSIMWKAEEELLTGQPDSALPYEKAAYTYLKLAKQAERIYVKRLGFVPPPVKESKRLTGELDDIHSYQRQTQAQADPEDNNLLFRQSFTLINQQSASQGLAPQQKALLERLKDRLTLLSQTQNHLIRQAALVQEILLADTLLPNDCEGCPSQQNLEQRGLDQKSLDQLSKHLWQLIDNPVSHPVAGQQDFINTNPLISDYVSEIDKLKANGLGERQP